MAEQLDAILGKVVDQPSTPTLFVEGVRGMQIRDGVAILNLVHHVYPSDGKVESEYDLTVARLVMPIAAFARLTEWFAGTMKELIDNGVVKVEAGGGEEP